MPKNAPMSLVAIVLLGFSILMLFFIILSGFNNTTPLNKTYFLRADTSDISGARDITQWTYFYFCGDNNKDCGNAHPAQAFGKAWDSKHDNAPDALVGSYGGGTTSYRFYYMWRFGWVFILIALVFEVLAFFTGFLACCGRLGAAISFFVNTLALFCYAVAASLTTATFVLARNKFKDDNISATLGVYAMGFLWGGFGALLISEILFALGMRGSKDNVSSSKGPFWRRKSTRSYEGRRVKDDYS